jgi:glycosyltransferase involved in cell wall biosynthesis
MLARPATLDLVRPTQPNRPGSRIPRMRVLSVLSSSNQLYSGIGRAVFELAKRLSDRIAFEFAIDDANSKNVDVLVSFCESLRLPIHVGRGRPAADALDSGNDDLSALVRQANWDAVECVCWANTTTNETVLQELGDRACFYTPHHQPTWTVPMTDEQATHIEAVHNRVIDRADLVLCDSPWERRILQMRAGDRDQCVVLPLGCDFEAFTPRPLPRREQLLFVGDFTEPRKRFDRVLALFARLLERRPGLRLVVIGNGSTGLSDQIPSHLRFACELRGYVSETELQTAYGESMGLLLLSDFEAFGLPILEALACGTPAFFSRQQATRSLFRSFPGAHFCPSDDLDRTLQVVMRTLDRGEASTLEVLADRPRLKGMFDWDVLAESKWRALASAWFRRQWFA